MRNTAFRIAVGYSVTFALAIAILGFAVYRIAHGALERELDDRISAEMSFLLSEFHHEGERELHGVIRSREAAGATNDLGYALFLPDGRRLAGSLRTPRPPLGWQTLWFTDANGESDDARALAVDIAPGKRLVVAADWDTLDDADHLILLTLAASLASVVGIGTVGALALGAFLRKRLSVISGSAEAIISGDLAQRIPVSSRRDEFDRLGIVLNTMLDRIALLLENLQQVSGDIAHDLRMPLTRLRNHLEQGLTSADPVTALDRAIEQTDDVLALFGSILRLSEIESGDLKRTFRTVDLSALATEIAESYGPAVEDGGRSLWTRIAPSVAIEGDRELLAQALINLLDNAQAHTPVGTRIGLTVDRSAHGIVLAVVDDGPGVPAADRERILRRFIRLEASRYVAGHGLGLSLVAAIAGMHGAALTVGDAEPGLIVSLVFVRA